MRLAKLVPAMLKLTNKKSLKGVLRNQYSPYIFCFVCGIFFFFLSSKTVNSSFSGLALNISASFISIPILYFLYESVQRINERERNKQLYNEFLKEINDEVDVILITLRRLVFPYHHRLELKVDVEDLQSLDCCELSCLFKEFTYLGFQVFKFQHLKDETDRLDSIANDRIFRKIFQEIYIKEVDKLTKNLKTVLNQFRNNPLDLFQKLNSESNTDQSLCPKNHIETKCPKKYEAKYKCSHDNRELTIKRKHEFAPTDYGRIKYCYSINPYKIEHLSKIIREIISSTNTLRDIR